jgi:hypothetical protein
LAVTFRPDTVRGAVETSDGSGRVDYRLARNAVVSEFRKGRLSRSDVCDAHPELLRAAKNVGTPSTEDCPICEDNKLVHVSYVFGSRMPAHGRCITTMAEMAKLDRGNRELACYVVEVCPECSWNHLSRTFPLGRARSSAS